MSKENYRRQDKYPFSFDGSACNACDARCCRGPKGYIWLTKARAKSIAESLNMSFDRFSAQYLRIVNGALSLREVYIAPYEYACVALNQQTNQCTIYEHRPDQCRTFPFWDENQRQPEIPARYCPGIILDS